MKRIVYKRMRDPWSARYPIPRHRCVCLEGRNSDSFSKSDADVVSAVRMKGADSSPRLSELRHSFGKVMVRCLVKDRFNARLSSKGQARLVSVLEANSQVR